MNILIPTDLSPIARQAVDFALHIHQADTNKLFFIHLSENDHAENNLSSYIQTLDIDPSVEVHSIVKKGEFTSSMLNEIADELSIDLIALATEGREGFLNTIIGSQTSKVINELYCPVMIVPDEYSKDPIKAIAYASDLEELDDELIQIIPFAKIFNATITILHIHPVYPERVDLKTFPAEDTVNTFRAKHSYPQLEIRFQKTDRQNQVIDGLQTYLNEHKPDLLIMFTRERGLLDKIIDGSKTAKMSLQVQIPLLSFPVKRPEE